MAWTKTKTTRTTENTNMVTVTATFTEVDSTVFTFTKDRILTSDTAARALFVSEAKAALLEWQNEKIATAAETTLLNALNN